MRAGGIDEADAAGVSGERTRRGAGVWGVGDGGEGFVEGLF